MRKDTSRSKQKAGATAKAPARTVASRYLALEQRVLLDAAIATTADAVLVAQAEEAALQPAHDDSALVDHLASLYQPAVEPRVVVFVDSRVPDIDALVASLGISGGAIEVHLLDASGDGLLQMQQVLADGRPADAVHLISHGESARLDLGGTTLDRATVDALSERLTSVGSSLSADANIYIYACNLAAGDDGEAFVQRLAELTGADIAASVDATGAEDRGGDWDLEYVVGNTADGRALGDADSDWQHLLADGWVLDADGAGNYWSVATTKTSDGVEWKFVSTRATSGTNYVYAYNRLADGSWNLFQTLSSTAAWYGWDIAAAGNRLVVAAPRANQVIVYTYDPAGGATNRWANATAAQTIGLNEDVPDDKDRNDGNWNNDYWGYSVDIATNGTGYQLVIGNPLQDVDGGFLNDHVDQGVAFIYTATSQTSTFTTTPTRLAYNEQQADQRRWGDDVAVGYNPTTGTYWTAIGSDTSDDVLVYEGTTKRFTITDWTGTSDNFGVGADGEGNGSVGAVNSLDIGGHLLAIGRNDGTTSVYTLNGTSATPAYNLGAGANDAMAVSVYDTSYNNATIVISTGSSVVVSTIVGGVVSTGVQTIAFAGRDMEIDQVRGKDLIMAGSTGVQSWHYNRDPVATNPAAQSVGENSTFTLNLSSNVSDPDTPNYIFGDVLRIQSATSANGATFGGVGTLSLTYNPFQSLDQGETLVDTVTVVFADGRGGTASSSFNVTVTGANDAPVAVNDSFTTDDNTVITDTVATNDYDVDSAYGTPETLTYTLVSGPAKGSLTFNPDGSFTYGSDPTDDLLKAGQSATYTFTYKVNDGTIDSATNATVTIVVQGVNDAPTPALVLASGTEDSASIPGNVSAVDVEGDAVTGYRVVGTLPDGVTFNTTTGAFTVVPQSYDQNLQLGGNRVVTFQYQATDNGTDWSNSQSVIVTINGANDAPYATATPLSPYGYQQSGSTHAYDFSGYFTDKDAGEAAALIPTATVLPSGWTAVADGALLRVTVPAGTAAGNYTVTVRVQDPHGATSDTRNFVIAVDTANNSPFVRNGMADQVALAGYEYTFRIPSTTFADPDPAPFDNITYTATLSTGAALPAWLNFDPVSGTFYGTPAAEGTITVRVTATDNADAARGGPLTVYDDFNITIVNPSLAQLAASDTTSPYTFVDGPSAGANLGFSTAISEDGNWLAVGAPQYNGYGAVLVYQWSSTGWVLRSTLTPNTTAGAQVGWSVDLNSNGTKLIVGARGVSGGQGAAYLFDRPTANTAFTTTVERTWTATGAQANDRFGSSVAFNDGATQYVAIGASHYDAGALTDSGAVFVTAISTASGALTGIVLPKDGSDFDLFGSAVAFDQNILIVSAMRDDNSNGMVTRIEFDDSIGAYASPTFGMIGGTLSTSAQFIRDGQQGDVVYLTGADGKVTLDAAVDLGASWTISSWFKGVSSTAGWRVLSSGGGYHQIVINSTGLLGVATDVASPVFTSSGWNISSLSNPSGWHHIAAVAEGTTVTFFVDGVKVGSAVTVKPTDEITTIGGDTASGRRFADYLDDFRVYNRALSQSEIRNLVSRIDTAEAANGDMGSIYVYSLSGATATEVTKLYAPDAGPGDMLGWAVDVDIYDLGGKTNQAGIIVASAIYNDERAVDGGAVYVWRTNSLFDGSENNGAVGNGTWRLESKLTSFDTSEGDYFGSDVAVDYDESTGGTRLLVGAQFEDTNGAYSGAVYAYWYGSGAWLPQKFVSAAPQGGSQSNSEFFGSAVAVADTRAVIGARWRDTGGQANDGAVYAVDLIAQGHYKQILTAETSAADSYFLPAEEQQVVSLDTSAMQGQVAFDASGRMVYTPGAAFKSLGIGQTATDTFTYTTEHSGVTYENTVTITVHGVDDQLLAGNDVVQVSASGATLLNVLANDVDPDTSGTLAVQSLSATALQGRMSITDDGILYDPRGRFDSLVAGETAQETFSYTVTNAEGQTSTAYVTLLIVGEDDPVVAVNDAATVKANSVVTVDVLANDIDKDGQDTFAVVALDTSAAQGSAIINADGTISYLPGSAFSYLKAGETATDTLVYTVRDASGNESSALLVITVLGVNDAPVAVNDAVTVGGGQTVAVDVLANDTDPDAGVLRVTRVISDGTLGTAVLNADGTISYTASAGAVADRFSYEVIDSLGKTSIATVFVNHDGGVPGGQGTVDDVAVTRGLEPVRVAVVANDAPGAVVVGLHVDGATGQVVLGEDGALVYTPAESMARLPAGVVFVDTFTYRAQLADGSVDTATVRIYVNGIWVAPALEEEERFALLPALQDGGPVLLATMEVTAPADAPAVDTVARMALDALVELAAAVPAEDIDVAPVQEAAPQPEAMPADAGKPALSAALHREALAKRAGVDALLKHFSGHAA